MVQPTQGPEAAAKVAIALSEWSKATFPTPNVLVAESWNFESILVQDTASILAEMAIGLSFYWVGVRKSASKSDIEKAKVLWKEYKGRKRQGDENGAHKGF
jgi:hypothetical protein